MPSLILLIASLTPYFASSLLLGLPNIHGTLLFHIEKYFYFLLVPLLWQLTLMATELFIRARPANNKIRTGLSAALLIALTIISLLALQIAKIRFVPEFFYLILTSIGLTSISAALHKKDRPYMALVVLTMSDLLMAQCSFLLAGAGSWQSLVFSAGISLQICAYRLTLQMTGNSPRLMTFTRESGDSSSIPSIPELAQRLYPLTLIAGVIVTSLLTLTGQLHAIYLALYLLLPLIIRLAEEYRKSPSAPDRIPDFRAKNGGILLFVVVMIASLTQLI